MTICAKGTVIYASNRSIKYAYNVTENSFNNWKTGPQDKESK